MDVQGGRISAGSPGGNGGGDEHPGGGADIRAAPGHGSQDAGLFSAAGLPAADSSPKATNVSSKGQLRPVRSD